MTEQQHKSETHELLVETRRMSGKIDNLSGRIDVGYKTITRLRRITIVCSVLLFATAVFSYFTYDLYNNVQATQTVTCENRNESAAASLGLWNYVLSVSRASDTSPTPASNQFFADMHTYIAKLYAPRDCANLQKKYPVPEPPHIPAHR